MRYAKRGRLRFSSHRDLQRALERAIRRAEVPIAFSAGFSPHPRISYANAAPTGAASEAEYLELGLSARRDPEQVRKVLDAALPAGLDLVEVLEARGSGFVDRLAASHWQLELPGVESGQLVEALTSFLAAERIEVQRKTKSGIRTFDARGAVVRGWVIPETPAEEIMTCVAQVRWGACAILHLVVRHSTPAVRPDDVLTALRSHAQLAPPSPPRMTRLAQGPLDAEDGSVADPLTADRGVVGA